MPTFEICCTATLELYVTVEAEDRDAAEELASDIRIINYANNTIGAETDAGEINQLIGHEVEAVHSVTEVE